MGLFSAIGSAISGAVGAIAGAVSSAFSTAVSTIVSAGSVAVGVVAAVAQVLGIFSKEEKLDDMGERALYAAEQGMRPDQFATHEAYMDSLRSMSLDPKAVEKYTPEQKSAAGVTVALLGITDKLGLSESVVGSVFNLVAANSTFFNADRVLSLLTHGVPFAQDVLAYFENRLNPREAQGVESSLVQVEKERDPNLDTKDLLAKIDQTLEQLHRRGQGAEGGTP